MSRIGVIADTHDAIVDWNAIQLGVAQAFVGVDLIVHCGDLTTTTVLDRLAEIAPVVAVRSDADPEPDGERLRDSPQVIEHSGIVIGVINTMPEDANVAALFGRDVDVVAHGGTHEAKVHHDEVALFVNPGSPSLADKVSVAIVEVTDGVARASIIPL